MRTHQVTFGPDSLTCHDGVDRLIPFDHTRFFPLDGSHTQVACAACYVDQKFKGLTTSCAACHQKLSPAGHYTNQCSLCHSTVKWTAAFYSHKGSEAANCAVCHAGNKPANHYSGQCSACHSTQGWTPTGFDHAAAGATDCQSCHARQLPANHYSRQCSTCHSTQAWTPATFTHPAGATDFQSCHAGQRPANHYTWQCSVCHSTSAWQNAKFNHTFPMDHNGAGGACSICHTSNTPAWTCAACHNQGAIDTSHKSVPGYSHNCMLCHATGKIPGQ